MIEGNLLPQFLFVRWNALVFLLLNFLLIFYVTRILKPEVPV